jgi:putative transcriptional regulator
MVSSAKSRVAKRMAKVAKSNSTRVKSKAPTKGVQEKTAIPKAVKKVGPALKSVRVAKRRVEGRTPRSDAFEAIHSAATALHSVGVIDKRTMRDFDASCLTPPSVTALDVVRIRHKAHVSQGVLARYMGIAKSTVVKWESAENTPSPMAQRLLKIIDKLGIDVIA